MPFAPPRQGSKGYLVQIKDRSVRRLTSLQQTASTARVLNLNLAASKNDPEMQRAPFFIHPVLNRAIIVKHRLRPNELETFDTPKANATKIMLPIDSRDLRLGAQFFFIGQRDFDAVTDQVFGGALRPGEHDRQVLDLIDMLPSLDPFLLREHLKRHGFEPARAYFNISDGDTQRMFEFVQKEIGQLVAAAMQTEYGAQAQTAKLVAKLLSNTPDADLGPLRATLRLNDQEYLDGIFSWRGFLYYKWMMSDLMKQVGQVILDVDQLTPRGPRDPEVSAYLGPAKVRIQKSIQRCCDGVARMLASYDSAYGQLTQNSNPTAFRSFLLAAPTMFTRLGEQLGAVQHIVSFWGYRFARNAPKMINGDELMDIYLDFEDSMTFNMADARAA
jgi:hypothetical protein